MVEQWKEAGIRVKINVMPSAQYWNVWTKVPFGFTTWAHRPLGTMVLSLAYRTGGAWNESNWSNAEFDKLITEAEGYLDVDKRRAVMAKLERSCSTKGRSWFRCGARSSTTPTRRSRATSCIRAPISRRRTCGSTPDPVGECLKALDGRRPGGGLACNFFFQQSLSVNESHSRFVHGQALG
jgi:hypothetical protein